MSYDEFKDFLINLFDNPQTMIDFENFVSSNIIDCIQNFDEGVYIFKFVLNQSGLDEDTFMDYFNKVVQNKDINLNIDVEDFLFVFKRVIFKNFKNNLELFLNDIIKNNLTIDIVIDILTSDIVSNPKRWLEITKFYNSLNILTNGDEELIKKTIESGNESLILFLSDSLYKSIKFDNPYQLLLNVLKKPKFKLEHRRKEIILEKIYGKIEYLDEEKLNYLIENNSVKGIENCPAVIKNNDYVKRILEKRYYDIVWNLEPEQILNSDLSQIIKSNIDNIIEKTKEKKQILSNKNVFNFFYSNLNSEKITSFVSLLPEDSISDYDAVRFIIDGYQFNLAHSIPNKILEHKEISDEDIKLLIDNGYEVTSKTRLYMLSPNQLLTLFNEKKINSQNIMLTYMNLDVKEFLEKNSSILTSIDNNPSIKTFLSYLLSNKLYEYKLYLDNIVLDVEKYFNKTGPTVEFVEFLLLKNPILFIYDDAFNYESLDLEPEVKQYILFLKKCKDISVFINEKIYITNKEKIKDFFNENGPKKELFDKLLFDSSLFRILFNDDYKELYTKYYESTPKIFSYVEFCKNINCTLNKYINCIEDINIYFDTDVPKKELFDKLLFDSFLFKIIFTDKYKELYTKYYESTPEIFSYIEFRKNEWSNIHEYISIEDINNYFDDKGPKKELYDKALFDWDFFKNLNQSVIDKYQYSDSVKNYIKFISLRNSMIKEIQSLEEIDKYFNDYGPKEEFFELSLNNYEIFMILKNNYQDIESSEKYVRIFEKYDELNEYFDEKYQFEKIFNHNTDIVNTFNIIEQNKERIKDYLKINDELFTTLNVKILDEKYKEIPEYLLQQIVLYPKIQDSIVNTDITNIKLLVDILKYIYNDEDTKDLDKTIIINNIINNLSSYSHLFENAKYNDEQIFNLITILQHPGNLYNIKSIEDLTNERFALLQSKQISIDDISTYNTEKLKDLLLFRLYGLDIKQAKFLIERYCTNIEYLKKSGIEKKYIDILIEIYSIVNNLKSDDELRFSLYVSRGTINDYKSTYLLESKIRAEFAKKYSDTLYKLKPQHNISNNPDLVQNKTALEILKNCTYNGKHPEIYMMDGDFNLQIHVLGAYRTFERPDNFQDAWNMPKISNHGICTSYIGNNQIAGARQYHPALAFQEYDGDEMLLCGPYDLGSSNTDFASSMEKAAYFIPPNQMINNTRHTHNEIVLERKKIVDGRIKKRQPSYLILFVDDVNNLYNFKKIDELTEEEKKDKYIVRCAQIYEETLQASIDFGLPIVIVDRLKYAKAERKKCDELLEEYKRTLNPTIMKKLLTEISNNIIGCENYFERELEYCKLFNEDVYNMYYNILDTIYNSNDYQVNVSSESNKQSNTTNSETNSSTFETQDEQLLFNRVNQFYLEASDDIRKQMTNDFYNGLTIFEIAQKIENQEYIEQRHL